VGISRPVRRDRAAASCPPAGPPRRAAAVGHGSRRL